MLMLAATSASADWRKVGEDAEASYHVDPASIVEDGGLRRVSVVHDYANPEPGGVRSRLVSYEIHCAAERLRSVAASGHSRPMAQGDRLHASERASDWHYVAARTGSSIAPRTPYRAIVRFVCSR